MLLVADRAGVQGGQTVLVHAGAGGVGYAAVQVALAVLIDRYRPTFSRKPVKTYEKQEKMLPRTIWIWHDSCEFDLDSASLHDSHTEYSGCHFC